MRQGPRDRCDERTAQADRPGRPRGRTRRAQVLTAAPWLAPWPLQRAGEVVRVDSQAVCVIEAVGGEALGPRARVEVQLGATEPSRLLHEPLKECPAVTLAPRLGGRAEVVDVEVVAPREAVCDAEPGDRNGLFLARAERADEPVAAGTQDTIDARDELPLVRQSGP